MAYTFLLGGARSGKSTLAVGMATAHEGRVVFLVTADPGDDEMAARIREHRAARPPSWETVEASTDLVDAVSRIDESAFLVVDCLTLWVSNELGAGTSDADVLRDADVVAIVLADRPGPAVVVSNEVGLGIVPVNELARAYRDLLGRVNAVFASRAERSLFVVAGLGLPLEAVAPA